MANRYWAASTVNQLAFPVGVPAGFDQSHPAAVNPRLSVVKAAGGNFRDVLTGLIGTPEAGGAASSTTLSHTGPSYLGTAVANTGIKFAGKSTLNDTSITMAAIGVSGASGNRFFVNSSFATTGGWAFGGSGANVLIQEWATAGFTTSSGVTLLVAGVPVFFAVSIDGATAHFIARHLDSGKILKNTKTGLALTPAAPDGTYTAGGHSTRQLTAADSMAAGMASAVFLNMPQLEQWARDPWAYWYPRH